MRKIVYKTIEGKRIPFLKYKDEYGNIIEERNQEIEALIGWAEVLNCVPVVTYLLENNNVGNRIEDYDSVE